MSALNHHIRLVVLVADHTFGTLRLMPEDSTHCLVGVDVLPATAAAIEQIKTLGLPMALLLPDPSYSGIAQHIKQFLPYIEEIVWGMDDLGEKLASCSKKLRANAKQTLFVAADRVLRGAAFNLGHPVAPHPLIAAYLARGYSLQFVRITGDLERFSRIAEVVPYHWERLENGSWSLLGVLSRLAVAEAAARRLLIEALSLDIYTEDPLLVQLDEINEKVVSELKKRKVLVVDSHRVLVALGPSEFNDSLAIPGTHGRLQLLMPSPELLQPAGDPSTFFRKDRLTMSRWPLEKLKVTPLHIDPDIVEGLLSPYPLTAASFQADVNRYSGATNLDTSGPIVSRHIRHTDNSRAVQALLNDLKAIGYCAYTHSFNCAGMTLYNVIADLPGTGYFKLDPNMLEHIRDVFVKNPLPDPPRPWLKSILRLLGKDWLDEQQLNALQPLQLKAALEKVFDLKPWFPWWLKLCPLPGIGAQIVIVGCHLDSSADRTPSYNPLTDPAPGADDNASGIAATLAIARCLSAYRGKMTHTVRFCFFNAEEQGMVGSKSYAAMVKAVGAPVKAVVCMDMLGYNSDAARIFEIHAGYSDPAVRDLSVPIAESIASWAASLGALAPAQVYKGISGVSGADRNLYDGAINRSDHASFHQQGYAATVVSEDFFINMPTEQGADPNPNYHKSNDTLIDSSYASDITCAVAYAVKELAVG